MGNINPKISVIVPVYKAEKYLHRCVDSLLAQTFQDFEILLIDDGSPDRSGEICDEYAKKNARIRVIHKINGGVSSARQCGIDNALGEYTIHADPDDWVAPNMLEKLYEKAKDEDADMVICDYYEERKNYTKYIIQKPSALDYETVLRELFQHLHGSCCNKLVRRICYSQYSVKFPEGINYSEDLYVCLALLRPSLKIAYLNKGFYHYDCMINENSITKKDRKSMYQKIDNFYRILPEVLDKEKYANEFIAIECRLAFAAIVADNLSYLAYEERFGHLKYDLRELQNCSSWVKWCIKTALSGHYSLIVLLVELRHWIGVIKRYIINK